MPGSGRHNKHPLTQAAAAVRQSRVQAWNVPPAGGKAQQTLPLAEGERAPGLGPAPVPHEAPDDTRLAPHGLWASG